MNGPMNGILNVGPAIDPLFLMYMTGRVSDSDHGIPERNFLTLIIGDENHQDSSSNLPSTHGRKIFPKSIAAGF